MTNTAASTARAHKTDTDQPPASCATAASRMATPCSGKVEFDGYFGKNLCHVHALAWADAEAAAEGR